MRARAIVLSFALAACRASTSPAPASSSNGASRADVAQAAKGVVLCTTTGAELRNKLGTPFRDGRLGPNRIQTWVAERERELFLGVLLDDRDVVVDVFWDVPGAVAWSPIDHCRNAPASPSAH
jgi:hypothetical protein